MNIGAPIAGKRRPFRSKAGRVTALPSSLLCAHPSGCANCVERELALHSVERQRRFRGARSALQHSKKFARSAKKFDARFALSAYALISTLVRIVATRCFGIAVNECDAYCHIHEAESVHAARSTRCRRLPDGG
jgi:hypothetical protein